MEKIRVLLIDDEDGARKTLVDYFELNTEIKVADYASGKEALADLQRGEGEYTAVILDFVLDPSMSGDEVLYEIQKGFPRLPVIVFSGRDPKGSMQTLGRGAYANLQRPLDRTELVNIIRGLAELESVFMQMAAGVKDLLNSDVCFAWRLDRKADLFRVAGWAGNADSEYCQTVTLDAADKAWQKFLEKGEPLLLSDVVTPDRSPRYRYRDKASQRGWNSLVTIPLVHQQRVIGLIDSYTYKPFVFRDENHERMTMRMLQAFAHQAAEAVRFADLSQQTHTLQEINQMLADTLEENAILKPILYKAVELVGADFGWLYMYDPNTGMLKLREAEGVELGVLDKQRELGEGITGWAADKGTVCKVDDVIKGISNSGYPHYKPTSDLVVRSEVAVPLRRGARTIGVLTVKSRIANLFTDDDTSLLMSLATMAAMTIERTKLTNHLQEVSRLALVATQFTELAEYVVEAVRDLTDADVNLWMMSPLETEGDNWMRIIASKGNVSDEYKRAAKLTNTPDGSINAQALYRKEPIIIRDIQDNKNIPTFYYIDEAVEHQWRSFMAVPMLGREDVSIGVLSLYSKAIGRFDAAEGQLMQTFANQAAVAFQQHKRASAMQKLAQAGQNLSVSIAESRQLLEQIAVAACDIAEADCTIIYPYDPIRQTFYQKESIVAVGLKSNEKKDIADRPRKVGLAEIVREFKAVVVHDVEQGIIEVGLEAPIKPETEFEKIKKQVQGAKFIQREDVKAFVGVSLRAYEKTYDYTTNDQEEVGVLYINFRAPHRFTREELQIIEIFAHQIANIIRGNRLYIKAQRQASELQAIHDSALRIVEHQDLQTRLQDIVEAATVLLQGKGGKVYLRVPGEKQLELVAAKGINRNILPLGSKLSFGEGMAGRVIQTKEPLIVDDYASWEGCIEWLASLFTAVIEVPLLLKNEAIGVIAVFDEIEKRQFNEGDREILERLAQQAALAIHSASLFELQNALYRIGLNITHQLNMTEVSGRILDELREVIPYDKATIQFIQGDERKLIAFRGIRAEDGLNLWFQRPVSQDRLISRVINGKKPAILSHVRKSVYWDTVPGTDDVGSWVGLPLVYRNDVIGLMTLDHKQPGFYKHANKDWLALFANQAAIAVQNAHYFEALTYQSRLLEALYSAGLKISAKLDVHEVLLSIAESVHELLHADRATIFPYDTRHRKFKDGVRFGSEVKKIPPPTPKGIAAQIVTVQEAIFKSERELSESKPFFVDGILVKAYAGVPLLFEQDCVGLLFIDYFEDHGFLPDEMELAKRFGLLAAIAIVNADLFTEMEKRVMERTMDLRDAQDRAVAAEKLAAIGKVGAEFVHRMNNLGGTIPVRVNVAKEMLDPQDLRDITVIRELDKILADSYQLLQAAQDIKLSTEERAPEEVFVPELLQKSLQQVKFAYAEFDEFITVEMNLDDAMPIIFADRNRLLDTLVNIIKNAVEAMPEGGNLTIMSRKIADESKIFLQIAITDTGIGIPAENLPRVFDLFFSTKERGWGFGLWRDKVFLNRTGGDIEVESVEGQGSTFTIKVPVELK